MNHSKNSYYMEACLLSYTIYKSKGVRKANKIFID